MANQLTEFIQFHGQARATGCLQVAGPAETAAVFLLDGEMAYAEAGRHRGLTALFWAMTWDRATVTWHDKATPPVIQTRQPVDALLFQFAQLEDNGHTQEIVLEQMFSGSSNEDEIKVMDFSKYQISFEVLNTHFKGFVFYLEVPISTIGRAEDCDVILPDVSVSSHHCKIVREQHSVRVVDLGSTNGTFINDELIDDHILQPGDEFKIGSVIIALQLRLKRHLEQATVAENLRQIRESAPPPPKMTQKLDPKNLVRNKARISGPITWKNLTGEPAKKSNTSLLAKMFGKK